MKKIWYRNVSIMLEEFLDTFSSVVRFYIVRTWNIRVVSILRCWGALTRVFRLGYPDSALI